MLTDRYYLIVPASGIGTRMKSDLPKQYLKLNNGLSVLDQTLKTLLNIEQIKGCVVAISNKDTWFEKSKFYNHPKLLAKVTGGKERFHSVICALNALKPFVNNNDWILVHDAARPCVNAEEVVTLMSELKNHSNGGLLATPVIDTIKQVTNRIVETTLDRSKLWQAQTPQMYRFGVLSKSLEKVIKDNLNITDEASAIELLELESVIIPSSKSNIKITTPEDLKLANFYLDSQ
ncbi:MAG: 2-C-methyl-D-erythritol 4-phosphate cytidylyltransferase [Candidatus Thioglobus sp.]|nr:2-C-methyl-D-erythritol 4-phosphate cytidylyltransferase [Candidatus Thioglobus sp.]